MGICHRKHHLLLQARLRNIPHKCSLSVFSCFAACNEPKSALQRDQNGYKIEKGLHMCQAFPAQRLKQESYKWHMPEYQAAAVILKKKQVLEYIFYPFLDRED